MSRDHPSTRREHDFYQQIETLLQVWTTLPHAPDAIADKPPPGTPFTHAPINDEKGENLQQQNLDLFQILVENTHQGLAVVQDFQIIYANPVLTRITGYSLEEMRLFASEIIMTALHVEDWSSAWAQVVDYVVTGVLSSRLELCFPHKSGMARWAETYARPIEIDGKPTILVSCVDITERKQAEMALYQTYSELELEVRERAEALVAANGALQGEILERRQIEEALRRAQAELEMRVQQRTQQLALMNESLQHEIIERRQAEQEIQLLHTISREIEKTQDFKEAMIVTLTRVCTAVEWDIGEAWMRAEDGGDLVCGPMWNHGRGHDHPPLDQPVSCPNLPHRVWQLRQTMWIEDLAAAPSALFSRKDITEAVGLQAALGVPIVAGNQMLATLIFFKCEPTPEDQRLVSVISAIATQLGSALERKRIQEEKALLFEKVKQQREQLRNLAMRRRHLAQQVILAQEEERRRVSRELHDEAGQALTALKVSLEMIHAELLNTGVKPIDAVLFGQQMSEAVTLCDTTSARIRVLAHNLRPAALDDLGLNLALEGFCRDFAERTYSAIRYTGDDLTSLSDAAELCLYRFLQEGLNNVTKHARANCVWVKLGVHDKTITLSIEDNGTGFDTQAILFAAGHTQGIGLLGIEERLESLGGSLNIYSEPGQGTSLVARIPLQEGI